MREKTKLPEIEGMKPKAALRAWQRWVADQDLMEMELERRATFVELAIKQLDMNMGRDAEESSRKNLAEHFAAFKTAFAAD